MDSGNSGSMQSSSGGDDQEFDSRGESISSFLNQSPHDHFASISAPPPPFLSHQIPNFFDPNLDQSAAQFSSDHDLIWSSRGIRPDQPYSTLGNLSSLQPRAQSNSIPFPGPSSSEPRAPPPPQPKNPKKRTRASRRAPTTVLTTDTSNFRQMVQEFTGIPAAPFSGSPYSRRLDLFSAASALRSGGHLDTLNPLYPLRPSAQKPPPFSSSPSLLHPSMMAPPAAAIGGSSSSNNFQLSTEHLLNIQQSAMNFGFLNRPEGRNNNNDDSVNRWKSGETVRGNDGGQENMVGFDGNINSGDSQNLSGYNLNLAEKDMENVAASAAEGTAAAVASWICPSD